MVDTDFEGLGHVHTDVVLGRIGCQTLHHPQWELELGAAGSVIGKQLEWRNLIGQNLSHRVVLSDPGSRNPR